MSKSNNARSDLQGLTRLLVDAIVGATDLVESMHKRVVHPPFLPSTRLQRIITNIAGITYRQIRWSTYLIGSGIDKLLGRFGFLLGKVKDIESSEATRSVLNGVIGDYLEDTENPLHIRMQFRYNRKTLGLDSESLISTYPTINGKLLLMVHGSCMNDNLWTQKGHNHGEQLAKELGYTPIYLLYNSGRHISTNGQNLSELLEDLTGAWPVPLEEVVILAHSMGGLVSRSALHYGQEEKTSWVGHVKKVIFLGTPHHGAPLEKFGNYLDTILGAIPYVKPFTRLSKVRSAGVTDLRYGNIVDEDWQDKDRFKLSKDRRQIVSLPQHLESYAIAGVAGKKKNIITTNLLGDKMVTVNSALGKHSKADRTLKFKKENTWIAYENNHSDLLTNPEVYDRIKGWVV